MVCTRALNSFTITPAKMIHITVRRGVKMNSKMVIEMIQCTNTNDRFVGVSAGYEKVDWI